MRSVILMRKLEPSKKVRRFAAAAEILVLLSLGLYDGVAVSDSMSLRLRKISSISRTILKARLFDHPLWRPKEGP